jgi:predicted lipid carrier protein YhbT
VTAAPSLQQLFEALARREYEPLLEKAVGTARFDIVDDERVVRWFVAIDRGHIRVSRKNTRADTVVRGDRRSFELAAAGKLNAMAAVLRGELVIEGDPRFLVRLQRLFPRPSRRR